METPNTVKTFIFANGEAEDGPMVRQMLAASPEAWMIAADGGARVAHFYGQRVQTLIGDLDSLSEAEVSTLAAQGAEIHRYPQEKNETDLELALQWAAAKGSTWIRVLGSIGGRLDQTLSNVYLLALPELTGRDTRLLAGKQEAWLAYPGDVLIEGAAGDTISLLPMSGLARGVRTENLYYPLRDETLAFGPARGISNVMVSSTAHVRLEAGILLVIHTLGRA